MGNWKKTWSAIILPTVCCSPTTEFSMEEKAFSFLKELIDTPSPSGFEAKAQEVVRKRMQTFTSDVETDVHGNVVKDLLA